MKMKYSQNVKILLEVKILWLLQHTSYMFYQCFSLPVVHVFSWSKMCVYSIYILWEFLWNSYNIYWEMCLSNHWIIDQLTEIQSYLLDTLYFSPQITRLIQRFASGCNTTMSQVLQLIPGWSVCYVDHVAWKEDRDLYITARSHCSSVLHHDPDCKIKSSLMWKAVIDIVPYDT